MSRPWDGTHLNTITLNRLNRGAIGLYESEGYIPGVSWMPGHLGEPLFYQALVSRR